MRGAGASCIATEGAAPRLTASTSASLTTAFTASAPAPCTISEPAPKCFPPASNASSATEIFASFSAYRSPSSEISPELFTATTSPAPLTVARWHSRIRHRLHLRLQNRSIRHAHRRHSKQIRERPPRIVIRMLLRIVRRPILPVQQRVRNPRIRLIHPDHIAPRRKRLRLRRIRLLICLLRRLIGNRHGFRKPAHLHMLQRHHPQHLRAPARRLPFRRNHVRRRPCALRLLNRPLRLQVKVLQPLRAVLREIRNRRQQCRLFVIIVVALRPLHHRQRRILLVPGSLDIHPAPKCASLYPPRHSQTSRRAG